MTIAVPFFLALCVLAPASPVSPASPARNGAQEKKQKPEPIFDEKADGSAQIDGALARARKENRRVLVEWGANWCSWCRALHGLCKSDEKIQKELLYEYDVVRIDVGRLDKHVDLMKRYGVDLSKTGIPYLTILDAEGRALANQETGSLELEDKKTKAHDPAKVLEFLERNRAAYLAAEDVFAAGLAEAKRAEKRVFLHFGAPWCSWCRRLESWMETEDVRTILSKEFVDLKIDVDRTVGGKDLARRLRGDDQSGIPWFAILDSKGDILARGDGPDGGPIGFPYEPAEIEAFGEMIAKGTARLTPEDVGALERSLTAVRERDERAKSAGKTPTPKEGE